MKHEEFINELNQIKLKGLENVFIGELLSTLYFDQRGISRINFVKSILSSMLFEENNYQICGGTNIWLISTYSYYGRQDLKHQFENVLKCIEHKSFIIPQKKFSLRFKRVHYLPLIVYWNRKFKNVNFDTRIKYQMIAEIFKATIIAEEVVKKIKSIENVKLCVTFCDVHPADYLITLMLNKCNIKTATLQHGIYDHITRYEFSNSHSQYFLAINEHAKEEAIVSGMDEAKINVLGPLPYIDKIPTARPFVKRDKTYGILLNGAKYGMLKGEDERLLDFGYYLSVEKKFNIIVRPHPLCNIPEHPIKKLQQYSECPQNVMLEDYLSKCDFVLTGSTTAYVDAFILGCPAYRYTGIHDCFAQIKKFQFCDNDQLIREVMNYYMEDESKVLQKISNVRRYLIPAGEIRENYRLFFKEFLHE